VVRSFSPFLLDIITTSAIFHLRTRSTVAMVTEVMLCDGVSEARPVKLVEFFTVPEYFSSLVCDHTADTRKSTDFVGVYA